VQRTDQSNQRCFMSAKEVVLRAAWEKGNTEWKGQCIYFNQDLSRDTIQKRKRSDEVKRFLHNYPRTQYPTGLFRVL
uniref:Uncharacterized protein n=1 Tax=Sparus aurata TaxID=8175 RepID=A0A671XC62_SPAAU